MKKKLTLIFSLLWLISSTIAKADEIAIDGSFSDWDAIPYAHTNVTGTGGTLLAMKTFGTATHIYFLVEGTASMAFDPLKMYFDTDNSSATGYKHPWNYGAGSGAEFYMESAETWGSLQMYSGAPSSDWNFAQVADLTDPLVYSRSTIVTVGSKKMIEFSIAKASLGTLGDFINVGLLDQPNDAGTLPATDPQVSSAKYLKVSVTGSTLAVVPDAIAIDGNFSDWDNIPYAHTNAAGTGGRLKALKTFGTATKIYFLLEGTTSMSLDALQIFLDTDNDPATGYNNSAQYGAGGGADFRLEGNAPGWGGFYKHSGNPADSWDGFTQIEDLASNGGVHSKSSIVTVGSKKLVEFSISKEYLGTIGEFINIAVLEQPNSYGAVPAIDQPTTAKYLQIPVTGNIPGTVVEPDKVVIDGNLSDWDNIPYSYTNEDGMGGTLLAVKSFGTATNMNFLLEGTSSMALTPLQVYFDTDNNPATGFDNDWQYGGGAGAEFRYTGSAPDWGKLAKQTGNGAWNFSDVADVLVDASLHTRSAFVTVGGKKMVEFSVSKAYLGDLGAVMNVAIFDGDGATAGAIPSMDPDPSTAKYLQVPVIGASTLPVSLVSFTAKSSNDKIKLNWSTYSEQNNSHFELYKSLDGVLFDKIATINGAVNSNAQLFYSYTDYSLSNESVYYQLKQVDLDGTVTSLRIVEVKSKFQKSQFNVYKVPGQDVLEVNVYADKNVASQFRLSDINGKLLINKAIQLVPGNQTIRVPLSAKAGIYVATLNSTEGLLTKKVLIAE